MQLLFIGTGSGKVSSKRYFSSFILQAHGYNLLIDCGDGISKALLAQNVSYDTIDGILITHLHPDHYSGLASLIVQMKLYHRKNELTIFINENLQNYIEEFLRHSYLFEEKLDFKLIFKVFGNDTTFNINENINFISKQNSHLNDYKKYDFAKTLDFSCSSFLFQNDGKFIYYSGDIGSKKDLFLFEDYIVDVFISEATHVKLEDLKTAVEYFKPSKILLTHISDEDETKLDKFTRKASQQEHIKYIIAYDGLKLDL